MPKLSVDELVMLTNALRIAREDGSIYGGLDIGEPGFAKLNRDLQRLAKKLQAAIRRRKE